MNGFHVVKVRNDYNKKGLDIPFQGLLPRRYMMARPSHEFALLGEEYVGMRPTMHTRVGDVVKKKVRFFLKTRRTPALSSLLRPAARLQKLTVVLSVFYSPL